MREYALYKSIYCDAGYFFCTILTFLVSERQLLQDESTSFAYDRIQWTFFFIWSKRKIVIYPAGKPAVSFSLYTSGRV